MKPVTSVNYNDEFNSQAIFDIIMGGTPMPVITRDRVKKFTDYPVEQIMDIDSIDAGDLLILIKSESDRKKIAGHHINSLNSFYSVGLKQIVTKIFSVEGRMRNERAGTDEDKEIVEIHYKVEFTDVNLTSPTTTKYQSGTEEILYPGVARARNLTYSARLYIDATITATATMRNGETKVKIGYLKNHRVAPIPCGTMTVPCNTFDGSKEFLKAVEEDPLSTGAIFIIKGLEWTIDSVENVTNNTFQVYKNKYGNEIARGTYLSKAGDAFENSYQVILRYLTSGAITIDLTTNKSEKFEVPFYLIFRMLGMTRDIDIVNNIVYGVENTDTKTTDIMKILDRAFAVNDEVFSYIKHSTVPADIITYIASKLNEGANTAAAHKDDNVAKYLNTNVLNMIDMKMFPHIGTDSSSRIKKLRFFGHLINKLICVALDIEEPTDRDSYCKRVSPAGFCYAKSFKTNFNFAVVQEIKKQLIKDFRSTPFAQIQLANSVKSAISGEDLERMLVQSITTGEKTITLKRNEITNHISSASLYHKNDMNVKSGMSSINPHTGSTKSGSSNERRKVHPSFLGYIDPGQSSEGAAVGENKQMCSTMSISEASSSFVLKEIISGDADIILLDDVPSEDINTKKLSKVFVNGDWIGCCEKSHLIATKYRNARRYNDIHHLTTIEWKPLVRELYFWVDVGRCIRPLMIVYNNMDQYIEALHNGKPVKFQQWIKLTHAHILGLQTQTITMDTLRLERVIEYISPEEQESAYLAQSIDELRKYSNDIRHRYTHCDIEQAIFGIVTLASPMANHSNATRIAYWTNHRKQSAGWYALNYPYRMDKNVTLQHRCEKPAVSTISDSITYPNGHNLIIAMTSYEGVGQEDSVILNQSSVDVGIFGAAFYTTERTKIEKGEKFGNPDPARTINIKKGAIYEYIRDGFVIKGTQVTKGCVLMSKVQTIIKPTDEFLYSDKSVVYKSKEPAIVQSVIRARDGEDDEIGKVTLRENRPAYNGDKVSSRHGNKGIISKTVPRMDMPYLKSGMVPDLIVNNHSIPSRMAVNQITEGVLGIIACILGIHIDATSFRDIDMVAAIKKLEDLGVKNGGHQQMYDGTTGEAIDTQIFIAPMSYQRLQKFIIDENYSILDGPVNNITHQPVDGKAFGGGLKIGEMEKDVIITHGTSRFLLEKFYDDSDGLRIPFCRNCGNRAVVNKKLAMYKCKTCGDTADIVSVPSSWVANTLFDETSAMNTKMLFEIEPNKFSKYE